MENESLAQAAAEATASLAALRLASQAHAGDQRRLRSQVLDGLRGVSLALSAMMLQVARSAWLPVPSYHTIIHIESSTNAAVIKDRK